jgi:DNA-binding transcriptional regulator GbsR (MarR family)
VTNTSPSNAVISGLFFDPAIGSAVATPTFTPPAGNYSSTQSVTIGTTTPGASIRYTTDGSTPTSTVGTVYSGPVSVNSSLTLKAIAYETGMTDSTVASGNYTIQVATPTFAPPAGSYGSTQMVTISTTTAGASIRYTTDGSTPSSTVGTVYSGPVSVNSSLTLKAIAYETGMTDSTVASGNYTIQVATPTFNPPGGSYSSTQMVTISTTTAGASIRYTTDGSTPSSTVGTVYGGPVSVGSNLTLKSIAYETGLMDSAVSSASYIITVGGSNSAAFVKTDTVTQGSWKGVYGSQGYNVFEDTVSYPAYVTVTPAGKADYIWASSTSDPIALQKALSPTDRIAATWYTSGSYTIDLNFTDGAQHQVAVYNLDYYTGGSRTQTLSILDGVSNAVLDSRNVSNFGNGEYLVWNLTGHIVLQVTNTSPSNAVISGLFFDPVH